MCLEYIKPIAMEHIYLTFLAFTRGRGDCIDDARVTRLVLNKNINPRTLLPVALELSHCDFNSISSLVVSSVFKISRELQKPASLLGAIKLQATLYLAVLVCKSRTYR